MTEQTELIHVEESLSPRYVLAWSGGKDSTATAILIKEHKLPLDEIVTVMPDPFSCELRFMAEFERFMGMAVTVIDGPIFEDYFFRIKGPRSVKHAGTIYGWPMMAYRTCARIMKWEPMQKYCMRYSQTTVFYVGIASNESRKVLSPNRSLLMEYGITEDAARALCTEYGLLNPMYSMVRRMGCVRCPKQCDESLRVVRESEPEKRRWMHDNDAKSPVRFRPKESFAEVEKRMNDLAGESIHD